MGMIIVIVILVVGILLLGWKLFILIGENKGLNSDIDMLVNAYNRLCKDNTELEEIINKKQCKYTKGGLIKEVEMMLSTTNHSVSYSQMKETFDCKKSSLTYALNNLIKQGKVKRVKRGWYRWDMTNNEFPDFPNAPITI